MGLPDALGSDDILLTLHCDVGISKSKGHFHHSIVNPPPAISAPAARPRNPKAGAELIGVVQAK
jgi:hypothetical protein